MFLVSLQETLYRVGPLNSLFPNAIREFLARPEENSSAQRPRSKP